MSQSLHVTHAVLSLDVGGLERIVLDLARIGVQRGDRVTVICLEKQGELAPIAQRFGAEIHCLDKPAGRHLEIIPKAASFLQRARPQIIHTHQIGPAWYLGQVAASFGIPLIHTEHGDPFARAKRLWNIAKLRWLYRQSSRWLRRFCCVSHPIAQTMRRFHTVPNSLLTVVPNGIRTDAPPQMPSRSQIRAQWSIPQDVPVIGTVGRLDEVKRQDLLIDAFARIAPDHPCHLLLVGDGPERNKLEQRSRSWGLESRIHFTGFQTQPEAFYRAMDIFALTSRSEGLPVSLLEAWSAEKPAVCTAVGGIPSILTHGVHGRLVPSGNVEAMANALRWCLQKPQKAMDMGRRGRAVVLAQYSLDHMADTYREHYLHAFHPKPDRGER
ncbi:MAG TPA: glycosyltransferase [Polyangiaceae bacterium]|nr:glycosyltransferase [Polyangiaceae bacterium]HNZ21497.1 glycosyltransferase [Polyangiaceae bacterium]HOD23677.1 glycosyltransferase [Polyangiaceae bacterium]HOE50025.1 glycosyltransferase [Polyangiaceae bacterium]HOH00818.1 glycosyltransferase [Polyangiaceae bacterium]